MTEVHTQVGRRIVSAGIPEEASAEVTFAAAERILLGLRARLGRWIGADAFDALLQRAFAGARARGGALAGVRWAPGSDAPLAGRDGSSPAPTAEEVRDGIAEALDEFTALLGRFVGDDLAGRLMLHDWEGGRNDPLGDP